MARLLTVLPSLLPVTEQLILHIEFQDTVKVHSVAIVAPAGGTC